MLRVMRTKVHVFISLLVLSILPAAMGAASTAPAISSPDLESPAAPGVWACAPFAQGNMYRINTGTTNSWLISLKDGWLLVDTGYPGDLAVFRSALQSLGLAMTDIRWLFLSHSHDDHAGFAATVLAESGARLIVPQASIETLSRGLMSWKGQAVNLGVEAGALAYNAFRSRDFRFTPIFPDARSLVLTGTRQAIPEDMGLAGHFLHTPGHSPDSWSLILDNGWAIVGDAAMNYLQELGTGYRPIFMNDREAVYQSMDAIRASGATTIASGHGPAFAASKLPHWSRNAPPGPGLGGIPSWLLSILPGMLLGVVLLLLIPQKGFGPLRLGVWILLFILSRDAMTAAGFWFLGKEPVFWLRFAADGPLLLVLGLASIGMTVAMVLLEPELKPYLVWFMPEHSRRRRILALGTGLGAAVLAAGPLLIMYLWPVAGERGGTFPPGLIPALLLTTLGGNLLEETLFRGWLQGEIVHGGLKPARAAYVSGLAFCLCHVFLASTVTSVGLPLIAFALWEGVICGHVRRHHGLAPAVLTHGLAVFLLAAF